MEVRQTSTVQTSLSTTALAMQRIKLGQRDLHEPGTRRERAYMQGISSVYNPWNDYVSVRHIGQNIIARKTTRISSL